LSEKMPDVLERIQKAIGTLDRPLKKVALDFQDQYWGDIGQHLQIYDFYMALNEPGPKAEILRTLADILDQRDENGNIIVVTHTSAKTSLSRIPFSSTSLLLVKGVLKIAS